MEVTGIISAIVVGAVIGVLARLVLPGRQGIGILMTILLGIVGAVVGGFIGAAITQSAVIVFVFQLIVAAALVAMVAGTSRGRSRTRV